MDELAGWCVIWIPKGSGVPRMTSNIADEACAIMHTNAIKERGDKIVACCKESDLLKLNAMRQGESPSDGRRCEKCGALMYHSRLGGWKCSRPRCG